MEDYETYEVTSSYGTPLDMTYSDGMLWWVGKTGSNYYLNITSAMTQEPKAVALDMIASFNITGSFSGLEPSGILISDDNTVWLCDTQKTRVFETYPRYDYFITDKVNRYLYFREDYRNSGVFVSNT
jgi:hypothetical protein